MELFPNCHWERGGTIAGDWFGFWCECDFCVEQAANDTDVETHKVHEGELVVGADEHAHVGDQDVLEAADDGGGEGGVVGRA